MDRGAERAGSECSGMELGRATRGVRSHSAVGNTLDKCRPSKTLGHGTFQNPSPEEAARHCGQDGEGSWGMGMNRRWSGGPRGRHRGRVGAAACTTPRKAVYSQAGFTPQPFHQRRLPTSPSGAGWSVWREAQLPPPGARLPLAALQLNTWALVPGLCADDSDSDAGAGAPSDAAGGDPRLIPDAPQRRPGTGVLLPGQSRRCGPVWARTNAFLASRRFLSQKPCPSSRHTDLREVESEGPSPCPGVPEAQL